MSLENALAFLAQIEADSALSARTQTADEAVRAGAALGLEFTVAELKQASAQGGDLSSDDLKNSAGGRIYV